MKILFLGNEVVGQKCLDHLLAEGHDVILAARRVEDVIPDVVVSVHCRDKIPPQLLAFARRGGINLHPFLDSWPGKDPVGRWLADGAQGPLRVSAHRMTDVIDSGEVLATEEDDEGHLFRWMRSTATRGAVYRQLYPLYLAALDKALDRV